MSAGRVVRNALAIVAIMVGLIGTGRVLWVGYGPRAVTSHAQVDGQLRFLDQAISAGAADRMQGLFPEGKFFTSVLTGLAEAARAGDASGDDRDRLLTQARARLAVADDPSTVSIFGTGLAPEHGVFAAGWSLSLAAAVARASGEPTDLDRVRRGAAAISSALTGSTSPFLAGYPGQYWPCDTVVAVSALAEASLLIPDAGWSAQVVAWRTSTLRLVEPETGLLPHRVTASGARITGPRGSSNTVIQAFWPMITVAAGLPPDDQWSRFTAAFVTREAGGVGIREYPHGTDGIGDVDSGPLVLGVSASASAVGLAAARVVGDQALASDLSREADLLGLPVRWPGGTRYAFGQVPVGDAFLVWARTRPAVEPPASSDPTPRPWFWAYALPGLVLATLGMLLWRGRRRKTPVIGVP